MNVHAGAVLRLQPLALPRVHAWPFETRLIGQGFEDVLTGQARQLGHPFDKFDDLVRRALDHFEYLDLLNDPLVRSLPPAPEPMHVNSAAEIDSFLRYRSGLTYALASSNRFRHWLCEVHSCAYGSHTGIRRTSLQTALEPDGQAVRYCQPELIGPSLERLRRYLIEQGDQQFAASCAVMLNGIVQIHPFPDGNGRTSRVLFNIVANRQRESPLFIPLKFSRSQFNIALAIKLNRARLNDSWQSLLLHLLACARLANIAIESAREQREKRKC